MQRSVAGSLGRRLAEAPLAALIGNTPLIRLDPDAWDLGRVTLHAKAEWFNPGGSVKDRPALWMIRDALQRDGLRPGVTLLDATSGNTGIALAMLGAALHVPTKLVLPANASRARQTMMRSFGAELVLTDPLAGTDGAQRVARRIRTADPDAYFYVDQYNNPANWTAHYESTGTEILDQTGGRLTHFVAGVGTGGTLVGTARRLKEHDASVQVVGVQPAEPLHGIEGLKHMETSLKPGVFDPTLQDATIFVETEEAQRYTRLLARREGLLVGTSSGAALAASLRVAEGLREGAVVTVFPDAGERYLSERYWEEG
ncbi:MAG: PLP-dependent cysteine synthase family protein [Thermoplasmata archaeon]